MNERKTVDIIQVVYNCENCGRTIHIKGLCGKCEGLRINMLIKRIRK
jgi:hypothetical protein